MATNEFNVAVFGTGYVGSVTAACLCRDGHRVIGVDIDEDKVAMINAGQSPVTEPGLNELISRQVANGRLCATEDIAMAVESTNIAIVAVGTPSNRDGSISLAAVENVIESIGRRLRNNNKPYTIVVRSTLLPGILEGPLANSLQDSSERQIGDSLKLCNNPEFLREGSALDDYDHPPFIVVGELRQSVAADVLGLYDNISADRIVTDTRTAAMIKYACNAFHALKIGFANEIGVLSKSFGADGKKVMEILCKDSKLNVSPAYLRPGFAFGGSCLPKDLRALTRHAEREAIGTKLLQAVLPSNQDHLQRAVDIVRENGRRKLGVAGLSFKAGTDDLRESPFVHLVQTLTGEGFDIRIYDPGVTVDNLIGKNRAMIQSRLPHLASLMVQTPDQLFGHADVLVVGTDVADQTNWQKNFQGQVIDLREILVVPESSDRG